jgi:predicted component of type VI protein secretion system
MKKPDWRRSLEVAFRRARRRTRDLRLSPVFHDRYFKEKEEEVVH